MAFIREPKIPRPLEQLFRIAEKTIGARMMPARLLIWTPKAFVSSMILEGLISHGKGKVSARLLKLIRMQVSLRIACPFCIDMNSQKFREFEITEDEIRGMQGLLTIKEVKSFTYGERLALYYARNTVRTPIRINPELVARMTEYFNEAEFASIVTTVGQVDYWTRVIQGLGIQQVGFLDSCDLDLLNATTKK